MIEEALIQLAESLPPWVVGALLSAAALSFLARYRAQAAHGRIREYEVMSVGVAAALAGLAIFYAFIGHGAMGLSARPFVNRALLSLLSGAIVAFNWGGVRVVWKEIRAGARGSS